MRHRLHKRRALLGAMVGLPMLARGREVARTTDQPAASARAAFMARAFALREESLRRGDQPFGAVVVRDGVIVGEGVSAVVTARDSSAHAEREAIRDAKRRLGSPDLAGCELYGTSRACPACEAAAKQANITRMYYGADVTDAGAPAASGG